MRISRPGIIATGAVLVFSISLVLIFAKNSPDATSKPTSPVAGLACAPGELKGANQRDLDPNYPGATTPEIALGNALAEEMPALKVSQLVEALVASSTVRYVFVEEGRTRAEFGVVKLPGGWRYAGWSACESFANKYLVKQ